MEKPRVAAIIPARGGSQGIPLKNLRTVGGIPLVGHAVNHAREAKLVDLVVATSDNAEIREVAEAHGAMTLGRPDELAHDNTWQEVDRLLVWAVEELEAQGERVDVAVLLYPTSPLRTPEYVDKAVARILGEGFDSVLSLYQDMRYLWEIEGETPVPTNYDPCNRYPRQQEEWNQWAENKSVYATRVPLLKSTGCRICGKVGHIEMPKWRSIDVDTFQDLDLAERLYRSDRGAQDD